MIAKLEYLKILLENSTEIEAALEDITSDNLPPMLTKIIEDTRDASGESIDLELYKTSVRDRIMDGANLIDLYIEMKAIEHELQGAEGLEEEANTIANQFWKSIEKALK
jgi:hypothetical protein